MLAVAKKCIALAVARDCFASCCKDLLAPVEIREWGLRRFCMTLTLRWHFHPFIQIVCCPFEEFLCAIYTWWHWPTWNSAMRVVVYFVFYCVFSAPFSTVFFLPRFLLCFFAPRSCLLGQNKLVSAVDVFFKFFCFFLTGIWQVGFCISGFPPCCFHEQCWVCVMFVGPSAVNISTLNFPQTLCKKESVQALYDNLR